METPTLILGNNNWAVKDSLLLGYYQRDGYYLPREFSFARTSTGSSVNRDGLIGTTAADIARIDFGDNSKGALLLEPSRTNLALWSEDLSNAHWVATRATKSTGGTAPDGSIADKILETAESGSHFTYNPLITKPASVTLTSGAYIRGVGKSNIRLYFRQNSNAANFLTADYNLNTLLITNVSQGGTFNGVVANLEVFSNGWVKCWITGLTGTEATDRLDFQFLDDTGNTSYPGDVTKGFEIWGCQSEEGSYPTSYIKTEAATVNRSVDLALISSAFPTSGEVSAVVFCYLDESIGNNSPIIAQYDSGADQRSYRMVIASSEGIAIRFDISSDGTSGTLQTEIFTVPSVFNKVLKIGFTISTTQIKLFINSSLIGTRVNNIGAIYNAIQIPISIFGQSINQMHGELDQALLFPSALTDQEMIELTT